jgi:hypothetical protein
LSERIVDQFIQLKDVTLAVPTLSSDQKINQFFKFIETLLNRILHDIEMFPLPQINLRHAFVIVDAGVQSVYLELGVGGEVPNFTLQSFDLRAGLFVVFELLLGDLQSVQKLKERDVCARCLLFYLLKIGSLRLTKVCTMMGLPAWYSSTAFFSFFGMVFRILAIFFLKSFASSRL